MMGGAASNRTGSIQRILLVAGIVLVTADMLWIWWVNIRQPYADSQFSYIADLVATESMYDPVAAAYGPNNSAAGTLYYHVQQWRPGRADMRITLSLAQTAGMPVVSITDNASVVPATGAYISKPGPGANSAYLFAPRHLRAGQSFRYRHFDYDAIATMQYEGQERLQGVLVYRYRAVYAPGTLLNEPYLQTTAVPSAEGLAAQPGLQLWVEPASGWLVKFEDSGTIVRFNRATKAVMALYSRYRLHYTDASVAQQAAYARTLKRKQDFAAFLVPVALGLIVIGGATYGITIQRKHHS